jgi:hypothetical protein
MENKIKITKRQLRRIIKEEKKKVLKRDKLVNENFIGFSANPGIPVKSRAHPDFVKALLKDRLVNEVNPDVSSSANEDIRDAIQMLETEEDATGTLYHVINRLYKALDKIK